MHKGNNLYGIFTLFIILLYLSFFYFIGCHKDINGPENNPSIDSHIPNLISPSDKLSITDMLLIFKWHSIKEAMMYKIQISNDSLFQSPVLNDSLITDTLYDFSNLLSYSTIYYGTVWYWRVSAKNSNIWGPYSEIWKFSLVYIPAPILNSPQNQNSSFEQPLIFKWNSVKGATMYRLQFSNSLLFQSLIVDELLNTDTSYIFRNPIYVGNYYWRVSAKIGNRWSPFSEIWNFWILSAFLEKLNEMYRCKIIIHAIHNEKNDRDSMRQEYTYEFPDLGEMITIIKWQGKIINYNFHDSHNSWECILSISAQFFPDGKLLEKLSMNYYYRHSDLYTKAFSAEVNNLPYYDAGSDALSYYFRIDGTQSKEHLNNMSYKFEGRFDYSNTYEIWRYISSDWNDSSFVEVKLYK